MIRSSLVTKMTVQRKITLILTDFPKIECFDVIFALKRMLLILYGSSSETYGSNY